MNDRQLRYALAVYHERSFSGAARRMHVSQPSISLQVALLEQELDFALFQRRSNGVEPTFLGRRFLQQAEQVVDGLFGLSDFARQLRRGPHGGLAIGVSSGISALLVPQVMDILGEERFRRRLEVITAHSPRLQQRVLQGALLLGVVVEIRGRSLLPELRRHQVGTVEMALFVPPDHRLARAARPVALSALADEPLIIVEPHLGFGALVLAMFNDQGIQPTVAAMCDNVETIKLMVRSGIGVAIMPAACAPYELRLGDVACVPLDPPRHLGVSVVHRRAESRVADRQIVQRIRRGLRERIGLAGPAGSETGFAPRP